MPNMIARWGNSLAVRIPKALADHAGLQDGTTVDITVRNGALVVTAQGPTYTLDDLVDGISQTNRHGETVTGPPEGRETW